METTFAAERVVVGVDGTPAGLAALRWAVDEATRRGAGLDVVHAWHPPLPALPDGVLSALDPEPFELSAWATLEEAIEAGGALDADVDVRALPVQDSPAGALVDRSQAALLVVGSRHRHVHGPWLGSVSQQCVLHAHCPVVVVPNGWTVEPRRGRVVVGVDGSPGSYDALRFAVKMAVERAAALDVVHAWQPVVLPRPLRTRISIHREDLAKDSQRLLEHMTRTVNAKPTEIELLSLEESASDALCAAAQRADLLVVGSRGRGGFAGLRLGSVSQRCLYHAGRPLAVVRFPTDTPDTP